MSFLDAFTKPFTTQSDVEQITTAAATSRQAGAPVLGAAFGGVATASTFGTSAPFYFGAPAATPPAPSIPDRSPLEAASVDRFYDEARYAPTADGRYQRPSEGLWDDKAYQQIATAAGDVVNVLSRVLPREQLGINLGDGRDQPREQRMDMTPWIVGGVVLAAIAYVMSR